LAQIEAFKHSTVPSITFARPSLNFSSSAMSRLAIDSVIDASAGAGTLGGVENCLVPLIASTPLFVHDSRIRRFASNHAVHVLPGSHLCCRPRTQGRANCCNSCRRSCSDGPEFGLYRIAELVHHGVVRGRGSCSSVRRQRGAKVRAPRRCRRSACRISSQKTSAPASGGQRTTCTTGAPVSHRTASVTSAAAPAAAADRTPSQPAHHALRRVA